MNSSLTGSSKLAKTGHFSPRVHVKIENEILYNPELTRAAVAAFKNDGYTLAEGANPPLNARNLSVYFLYEAN